MPARWMLWSKSLKRCQCEAYPSVTNSCSNTEANFGRRTQQGRPADGVGFLFKQKQQSASGDPFVDDAAASLNTHNRHPTYRIGCRSSASSFRKADGRPSGWSEKRNRFANETCKNFPPHSRQIPVPLRYWSLQSDARYLANYGWRYLRGMPLSSLAESAVNEVVSPRLVKKRQMRWVANKKHHVIKVRLAVLDGELRMRGIADRRWIFAEKNTIRANA